MTRRLAQLRRSFVSKRQENIQGRLVGSVIIWRWACQLPRDIEIAHRRREALVTSEAAQTLGGPPLRERWVLAVMIQGREARLEWRWFSRRRWRRFWGLRICVEGYHRWRWCLRRRRWR